MSRTSGKIGRQRKKKGVLNDTKILGHSEEKRLNRKLSPTKKVRELNTHNSLTQR